MAVTIADADAYVSAYCIDSEDWTDADESKKQRILNVAERILTKRYAAYTIPDNAVYDYSAVLAVVFNDTNRLAQHNVASFSVTGVAAFNFKDGATNAPGVDLARYIPQSTLDLISEANDGVTLSKRRVGWSVL